MTKEEQKKECNYCGGTGQVSYFKGVSRFLLSTEECDECAGTGFPFAKGSNPPAAVKPGNKKKQKKKK